MSLQDLNKVAVQSTGQTVKDLLELNALWSILQVDDNPYISESWLPPAILNPEYIPERQQGLKIGLTVVFLFGLLTTGSLVGFKVITTQKHRAAKTLFLEDWLLVLALFSGYAVLIVSFVSVYKYQAGWHIWDVHIESAEETFKISIQISLDFGI
ncbi:hypothetical protein DRE_04306 [Drechslerella stenobrocha 248]|uniref:Uncharacterized protein n=1 Tax=Drechslerella stenobrocha 248 TaxID=1043628 RepID=W7I246_9PEZI|nr:hypothetical protein DRE_04306 [Drechslerella stenobrocha 248]